MNQMGLARAYALKYSHHDLRVSLAGVDGWSHELAAIAASYEIDLLPGAEIWP